MPPASGTKRRVTPQQPARGQPDLANVIGWAPLQGSTAGVTGVWYQTQGGVPRLIDGDIILSPTLVTTNGQLDRVAAHEWGHLIGRAHSNMNGAVMSGPSYSTYNSLAAITDDDVRGCRCPYGAAAGQSAGYLCTLPRELAVGTVPTGATSAPKSLTLTNDGNAPTPSGRRRSRRAATRAVAARPARRSRPARAASCR